MHPVTDLNKDMNYIIVTLGEIVLWFSNTMPKPE